MVSNYRGAGEGLVDLHGGTAGVGEDIGDTSELEGFDENIGTLAGLVGGEAVGNSGGGGDGGLVLRKGRDDREGRSGNGFQGYSGKDGVCFGKAEGVFRETRNCGDVGQGGGDGGNHRWRSKDQKAETRVWISLYMVRRKAHRNAVGLLNPPLISNTEYVWIWIKEI